MNEQPTKNLAFEIQFLNCRINSLCQILHSMTDEPAIQESIQTEIARLNDQLKRLKVLQR
uniref:Uncharacterized protein n=1 Tax=Oscillatoriales cyanobacterium SpSt-402 TaxID=2282168 RepID=A0A832H126_9CYAN